MRLEQILKIPFALIVFQLNFNGISAQGLEKSSLNYLKKNSFNVEVDDNYQNGDWKGLNKFLKSKRIVLLGEFNHGSKQIFETRNDLIKYLHQNFGFNTIFFEGGVGELIMVDTNKESLRPEQMTSGFFGGWRTKEFVELMAYIKENNLALQGFDIQRIGENFIPVIEKIAIQLGISDSLFKGIERRFAIQKNQLTNRKAVYDSLKTPTMELMKDYKLLLDHIEIKQNQEKDPLIALVVRTIINRVEYLNYFLTFTKDKDWNQRWKARDSMMASNIKWLLEHNYKDEKVIVIAHNFHIAKYNDKEEVMGEFLEKDYGSKMYALGIFAGQGSYSDNSGKEKQLSSIDSQALDIKSVIMSLDGKVNFIPIPKRRKGKNAWMFRKVIVNDTFIDLSGSNEMNLSKQFDGLLMIDKISPPVKQ